MSTAPNDFGYSPEDLPVDAWERREEAPVREIIVLSYWPMLCRVVGRVRQSLPPHVKVEEDDLRSYGLIGMYKAVDKYDPEQGTFSKFASNYVYGAVYDNLRSLDWAPRSLRKRQKDLEAAQRGLVKSLGRTPTESELALELRWTTADVSNTRRQIDCAWPRSLDEIRGEANDENLYAIVADAQGTVEEHVVAHVDSPEADRSAMVAEKVSIHINKMPAQKRAVAIFCYYLNMKQSEVARVLGIPESRVSGLHLQFLEEIHQELERLLLDS